MVALVVGSWTGAAAVLTLSAAAGLLAVLYLMAYPVVIGSLESVLDSVSRNRLHFAAFLVSLILAPLVLVLLP